MKLNQISNELRDWIIRTLKNGGNPIAIANGLIKKGFDAKFAYETLFQIVGNQQIKTSNDVDSTYHYDIPEIGKKGNHIMTNDCHINVLSRIERPFILHLDDVLSSEECAELINLSRERLQPSRIVDPITGEEKNSVGRTSKGMAYNIMENPLITKIEQRIADLTNYPIENGEGLQVLNYEVGEEYKPHFDFFPSNKVVSNKGGQRICTLLIYLNDVPSGGETVFPKLGLSITPKKGTAVYFHYANSEGHVDRMSVHSSVPIIKGEKWVATKWIRENKLY